MGKPALGAEGSFWPAKSQRPAWLALAILRLMTPQFFVFIGLLIALTVLLWAKKRRPQQPVPVTPPPPAAAPDPSTMWQEAKITPKRFTPKEWQLAVASLARRGDSQAALTVSQRFEQTWPILFSTRDRLIQAQLLTRTGQLPEAVAVYTVLLSQPAPDTAAYNNRGYLYNLLEDYKRAIPDFDRAIALGAYAAYAHNNRGLARLRLGFATEGLADIELSLQLDPSNAYAHRNLGIYYFDQGNYAAALPHFEHAHQLGTHPPGLADYLRQTRQHLGLPPAADEPLLPLTFSDN